MPSRQEIRARRQKRKQQQRLTTILIIVGSVFIIAAVLMMPTIRELITPVGDFVQPRENPRFMADGNRAGDPDAPVTIVEFSDFGCGHCANFALSTGEIIFEQYVSTGQVQIVYNSVGSMLGHPNSITTIEAAYCAGDQNKFWEFHDLVYANQAELFANVNKKIDKTMVAFAESLSLDIDSFEACIKSNKYDSEIEEDFLEAIDEGVNSTPSFLINDQLKIGNIPLAEFQAAIEAELNQ
jgi:protein-disulfide isomerase